MAVTIGGGPVCPVPIVDAARIQLGHGSGGKMSAALLKERFLPHLGNPVLEQLGDAAVLPVNGSDIAISTDTFVVNPVEFPGGNIGSLSVHGTLNDLAMVGARPVCLTVGFVLEEGLDLAVLDRVLASMAEPANAAGVPVVSGDTKVVARQGGPAIHQHDGHRNDTARFSPGAGPRPRRRRGAGERPHRLAWHGHHGSARGHRL